MSDEITPRHPENGAVQPRSPSNTLTSLPHGFVDPVSFLWEFYAYVLPSPASLVLQIKVWVKKRGLTSAEVKQAMEDLCSPEVQSRVRFPADFFAEFGAVVLNIVQVRENLEAQRDREEQDARDRAVAAPPGEWERRSRERWGAEGLGSLFKGVYS